MKSPHWLTLLGFFLATLLPVWARVGGGESYSGGGYSSSSSSSSSGGSSSDGEAIGFILELLIRLVIYYPKIGIPLVIGIAVAFYYYSKSSGTDRAFNALQNWSAANSVERRKPPRMNELKLRDPNFSPTLFLDFVNSVYSKLLLGAGGELSEIGGYLKDQVRSRMESAPGGVKALIIGSTRLVTIQRTKTSEMVEIEFESNLSLEAGDELYVVDRAVFMRGLGVKTNPPETVYALSCPHCGNNEGIGKDGRCGFCQEIVNDGRWGWTLAEFQRIKSTPKPPVVLSSGGLEIGTDMPTERSASLLADLAGLKERDPGFEQEAFLELARQTFLTLQQAWTEMKWEKARPLETDDLFQQHHYWIESYRRMGYRNVLEDVQVTDIQFSQVSTDPYFEGITVRIFATMKDYTVRANDGRVLSGSPNQIRKFSEYWTFVRRAGVTSKQRDAARCPSCGAPLDKVTHVGVCEYCQAKLTRGDFDWILSRIEQDEAYYL